jgi:hypothetical protein
VREIFNRPCLKATSICICFSGVIEQSHFLGKLSVAYPHENKYECPIDRFYATIWE